jgi:hypothetical protein
MDRHIAVRNLDFAMRGMRIEDQQDREAVGVLLAQAASGTQRNNRQSLGGLS